VQPFRPPFERDGKCPTSVMGVPLRTFTRRRQMPCKRSASKTPRSPLAGTVWRHWPPRLPLREVEETSISGDRIRVCSTTQYRSVISTRALSSSSDAEVERWNDSRIDGVETLILAKVRVAGSNLVVRSREGPGSGGRRAEIDPSCRTWEHRAPLRAPIRIVGALRHHRSTRMHWHNWLRRALPCCATMKA